MKPAPVFIQKC